MSRLNLVLPLLSAVVFFACGADWLRFRGDDAGGALPEAILPLTWSDTENVAWKKALPGKGVSSPIVVDGHVIVTASSGVKEDRLHVLSFAVGDGKLEWERQFWATGPTLCHPTSAVAANTPASDGKLIYAFFSSNDLICLDTSGNLQWFRGLSHDYPAARNDVGMASSPLVIDDTVVVQIENQGDSFAAGLDKNSGETRWRVDRPPEANWASPVALRTNPAAGGERQGNLVLLCSPSTITAHDVETGEQRWAQKTGCSGITTAAVAGDIAYIPGDGIRAVRVPSGSSNPEVLWTSSKLNSAAASPIVHQGKIYAVNRAGVLTCGDISDGEVKWQLRLKGNFWATPVLVGEHLYYINQDGLAQVVKLADDIGEVIGESSFGEPIYASPAVADGALFVRGGSQLWKIAKAE